MLQICPNIILSQGTASLRQTEIYIPSIADGSVLLASQTFNAGDVKITKNGAAEANHSGTFTEIGSGFYYYTWTLGEIDTRGTNAIRLNNSNWKNMAFVIPIVNLEDDILGAGSPNSVETGVNVRQSLRVIAASVAGLLSGLPAGPAALKGLDKTTDRVSVTFDSNNNRTSIIYTFGN